MSLFLLANISHNNYDTNSSCAGCFATPSCSTKLDCVITRHHAAKAERERVHPERLPTVTAKPIHMHGPAIAGSSGTAILLLMVRGDRYNPFIMRFVKSRNGSTRFLHVSGAGSSLGTSEESIREVFRIYGPVDVVLVEGRRFCFIIYQGVNATI